MPIDAETLRESLKAASGDYRFERILGNGSYGDVVQARFTKTGELVAAKRVKEDVLVDDLLTRRMYREILVMQHLHWTVVGEHRAALFACLRDILLVPDADNFDSFWMIMDLCDCDLRYIIGQGKRPGLGGIEMRQVRYIVFQLLHALKTMKDAHIIHRDIQAANVLINCETLDAKVCDFGMAKHFDYGVEMNYLVTMQWYRAPELLLKSPYYDYQVDLWGVGCILADLVALHGLKGDAKSVSPVFKCQPPTELEASIGAMVSVLGPPSKADLSHTVHPTIPGHQYNPQPKVVKIVKRKCSSGGGKKVSWAHHLGVVNDPSPDARQALSLLDKMLVYHPFKRITVEEALACDWFTDLRRQYTELEYDYAGEVPRFSLKQNLDLDDVDVLRERIYKEAKRVQAENRKPRASPSKPSIPHSNLPMPQHPGNHSFGPMTFREPGAPVNTGLRSGHHDPSSLNSSHQNTGSFEMDHDFAAESTACSDVHPANFGSGSFASPSFANTSFAVPPSPGTKLLKCIATHLVRPVTDEAIGEAVMEFLNQDGLSASARNVVIEAGFSPRSAKFRRRLREEDWKKLVIALRKDRRGDSAGGSCWEVPPDVKPLKKPPASDRVDVIPLRHMPKKDHGGCCGDGGCTIC